MPSSTGFSPRLTISFSAVQFARVAALAERLGVTAAAIVRRAVATYIRWQFLEPEPGVTIEAPSEQPDDPIPF